MLKSENSFKFYAYNYNNELKFNVIVSIEKNWIYYDYIQLLRNFYNIERNNKQKLKSQAKYFVFITHDKNNKKVFWILRGYVATFNLR